MTRWARAGTANRKKPMEASSWGELSKNKSHESKRPMKIKQNLTDTETSATDETSIIEKQNDLLSFMKSKVARSEKRRVKRLKQRESSKVCYNCRQLGHYISDCPNIKSDCEQGTGICFKCGSTEHLSGKCSVKLQPGQFPYAKCFICKESGHLSNECPDNPRGLYPVGGCCLKCGSVEHLKKDCPKQQNQQGNDELVLATLDNTVSADAEIQRKRAKSKKANKSQPKLIKF